MAELLSLLPIRYADVVLGEPLRQTVYDWHGNVLLASGTILQTQSQLDELIGSGFFQDQSWHISTSKNEPPEPEVKEQAETRPHAAEAAEAREMTVTMDEIQWPVGEAMTLQPHDKPSIRYAVQLIGFVKKQMVFVTAPAVNGKFELIRDGQTFIARAFSGRKAYAFVASAMKSIHSPHPYLLLSYPREVRCTLVRQSARVQVKIIAAISLGQPERSGAGILTDLSMGGASMICKEPFGKKGEEGRLKFKVSAADADSYLNLTILLRSVAKGNADEGFRHGIEFINVSAHDRLILSAYVHETLVEIT